MKRPLLALSACVGAGALVGSDVSVFWAWILVALAASLLALACAAPSRVGAFAALGACAVAIGGAAASAERAEDDETPLKRWLTSAAEGPVRIVGRAAADAQDETDRWRLLVDVENLGDGRTDRPMRGRARIGVGGQAPRPEVIEGDRLALWATLRTPRGFNDPAVAEAAEVALRAGVQALGYCKSPRLVETRRPARPAGPSEWAARLRCQARRDLVQYITPGAEQGVVRAMVLGDKTAIDPDAANAFRIAGTYHVLAISGAQVALVAALVLGLLRRAGMPRGLQAALVAGSAGFYAILVGGDVPVVRAAIMTGVLLLGRAADLESDLANLLGLAAGLLLVARPCDIGDAGFQLSFAATLGLLVLSGPVAAGLPRLPLRIDRALAASVAAQLALVPLLVTWFHRLAPAALVLNLVAVPLSGAVLLAGLGVVVAAHVWPWAAYHAGGFAWLSGRALLASGEVVRGVPLLDSRLPSPSPAAVALYLAGLTLLVCCRRRKVATAVTAVGLVTVVFGSPTPAGDGRLHLEVVDVGEGDCLVLRSPAGRTWVVDAGGAFERSFDSGERVVGPHLWSEGIRRIDTVLMTHAHPDHVGGVPFLLRNFRVGELWEGPAPLADPTYVELQKQVADLRVSRRSVFRGVSGEWDGVSYEVLSPGPHAPPRRARNDDSVVLAMRFGEIRLLLPGDIEASAEGSLGPVPAAVLKVPHHGSRTSSTPPFVDGVKPRLAIVSVGYRSPLGHPNQEVLERYVRAGARVLRTDRDGTVSVSTDGRALWVRTAVGGVSERLP
jgi:competence protein ComEC